MHFLSFLFIKNSFASETKEDWRSVLVKLFTPNMYQTFETKTKINYLIALQMFDILATEDCFNDSKCTNPDPKSKAEESKAEESKAEESKAEESKAEESKAEESKAETHIQKCEDMLADTIEKIISKFKVSNVQEVLDDHKSEIHKILCQITEGGIKLYDEFKKLFKIPVELVNNEYQNFEQAFNDCKQKVNNSHLGKRARKVLEKKLDMLKFLVGKQYESNNDLKELIESISSYKKK